MAKAPGDPQPGPNGPPPGMFAMLQNLLADRFQLILHRETKDMAIYALVLARADGKLGPQLKPAATDCAAMMAAARGRGAARRRRRRRASACPAGCACFRATSRAAAASMAQLTNVLARFVNRTVVDQTGLTGNYDLGSAVDARSNAARPGRSAPGAPALPAIDPNGPSIFTAVQEQLGLKLESHEGPSQTSS